MRVPERLVEVWAKGADGPGKCGSGWVVGHSGVVSCRHVLERYLASTQENANASEGAAGQAIIQVRQAALSSAEAWVDCALVWQHPDRDLVLLRMTPRPDQSWESPKGLSRLAGMDERPSECVAMGFPDAEARPTNLRDSDQVTGRLLPAGRARDPDGLVPFDVIGSVRDAALWGGFSGSAVVDQRTRLVGLVAKVDPGRQPPRLLVVPVEGADSNPSFLEAAAVVGLDPAVVEDFWAPAWRDSVEPEALTAAGVPRAVADVKDPKVFGVAASSSAAELGYISRDKDAELSDALAGATTGGQRVVLVVGDSAAGKTRSAAEMLRRDRVLRCWKLVVPLSDGGLSRLADAGLGWQKTIIWLDDLDKYLGSLDLSTLRRILGQDPTVVVVATMRAYQLRSGWEKLTDPARTFLTDESKVKRVALEAPLSEDELQAASDIIADPALLKALREGVGLGEWLIAGPELMARLEDSEPHERAFADTVIAWYRTGQDQPLASEDVRRLWADALSQAERQLLLSNGPKEQGELFGQASTWACTPVLRRHALYGQALITKVAEGYVANDYVLDQVVRDLNHPPIPDSVWEHSLRAATSSAEPSRLWEVAAAAQRERAFAYGLTAMQTLADAGDVRALAKTGFLRAELGQLNEAVGIYDEVVARIGEAPWVDLPQYVAVSLVNKGVALGELGRMEEAAEVYDEVMARFEAASDPALRAEAARALIYQANTLSQLGWSEEASVVHGEVADRFGSLLASVLREHISASLADNGLALEELRGLALEELRGLEEVAGADAEDSQVRKAAEPALLHWFTTVQANDAATLGQLDRPEEAARIYGHVAARFRAATKPTLRMLAARALFNKAAALEELGQLEESARIYGDVVERVGAATKPTLRMLAARALFNKAAALEELGQLEESARIYGDVLERFGAAVRYPKRIVPPPLYASPGSLSPAEEAARFHGEEALRELVAEALVNKGRLLGELSRLEEAAKIYDKVVDRFGRAYYERAVRGQVARALVNKGRVLGQLGRLEEAAETYGDVVERFGETADPALCVPVAEALVIEGAALGRLGQHEAEIGAYNQVVARFGEAADPGLRVLVARALVNKGRVLGQLGRLEEAAETCGAVVERFGETADPALRVPVAEALVNRAWVLGQLGQHEAEIGAYDQVVARFEEAADPALRALVAKAREMKAKIGQ
jgi:tetratricopeptide (TPR) repeat protein